MSTKESREPEILLEREEGNAVMDAGSEDLGKRKEETGEMQKGFNRHIRIKMKVLGTEKKGDTRKEGEEKKEGKVLLGGYDDVSSDVDGSLEASEVEEKEKQ